MPRIASGLMLLVVILVTNVEAQESLSNDAVIKLVKAGVSEQVIIEMINGSPRKFRTDVKSLVDLKEAGVSESLLLAMLKKDSVKPSDYKPELSTDLLSIAADTIILVRLLDAVGTNFNRPGDTFECTLEEPIVIDGVLVAERRAPVLGRLVVVQPPGKETSGVAQLSLELEQIQTVAGALHISTELVEERAEPTKGPEARDGIAGAIGGALVGAALGGGRGAIIGATAGGAGGAVLGALTSRTRVIFLEPETLLRFRVKASATLPRNQKTSQPPEKSLP